VATNNIESPVLLNGGLNHVLHVILARDIRHILRAHSALLADLVDECIQLFCLFSNVVNSDVEAVLCEAQGYSSAYALR
jgi:hypothetical protein